VSCHKTKPHILFQFPSCYWLFIKWRPLAACSTRDKKNGYEAHPLKLLTIAQSCKRASFWSRNPTRNHKPESGPIPTFIFEARFRPENRINRASQDERNSVVLVASAPDLGGPRAPHHVHVFSRMCDICVPLSRF